MKTAACRSCGATILWATTARTGSRMPLDAEPVAAETVDDRGLHVLLKSLDDTPVAITPGWFVAELEVPIAYYRSHFATCDRPEAFRKKVA